MPPPTSGPTTASTTTGPRPANPTSAAAPMLPGPTAEQNPQIADLGAAYTHAFGNNVGQFVYDFSLPSFGGSTAKVTARLSSNFTWYTAPPDGYTDVTVSVNGVPLSTLRAMPDNGAGALYGLVFDPRLLKVGANQIAFQVRPDAEYRNGLCIYHHALVPGQKDQPVVVETLP